MPKKTTAQPKKPERPPFKPLTDPIVVQEFLMGKHCLYGGSGWWKYEFCYGKVKLEVFFFKSKRNRALISIQAKKLTNIMKRMAKEPQSSTSACSTKKSILSG